MESRQPETKRKWDLNLTWHDLDFINAALEFLQLPAGQALQSENAIIRIFAALDKRMGRRTLEKLWHTPAFEDNPEWVKQFYQLRKLTLSEE